MYAFVYVFIKSQIPNTEYFGNLKKRLEKPKFYRTRLIISSLSLVKYVEYLYLFYLYSKAQVRTPDLPI